MNRPDETPDGGRKVVTVIGGTGFLGRRIVRAFAEGGYRVRAASRHPEKADSPGGTQSVEPVRLDIHESGSLAPALAGSDIVVNAISLYVESGGATFHSVHVAGAERVAEAAREAGAGALVHISGLGADRNAEDPFIRSRGEGEDAVLRVFPEAAVLRPSVMFAADAGFLVMLADLVRKLPVLPLFGRGETRLQPVHADDVAQAVVCVAAGPRHHGAVHHAGGPAIYRYRELVELTARQTGARALLLPFPFALWSLTALVAERLPGAPVTRSQVALMRMDNTADNSPVFAACGIKRQYVETALKEIGRKSR